jgi:hypothetical protein
MSEAVGAAGDFSALLASVRDQLNLPEPARSRILLEIADDLEELYRHHRSDGVTDFEARRRVEDAMQLSSQVLAEIVKVHSSPYQRFLDNLSSRARSRWERGALLVLSLVVSLVVLSAAVTGPVFVQAGPFLWPVLACFLGAFVLGFRRAHALFLGGPVDARRARDKLGLLLVIGAVQPALGLAGAWLGLVPVSWTILETGKWPGHTVLAWMTGASALMLISIAGAILVAIAWLILVGRAAAIEEAAVNTMGAVSPLTEDNEEIEP